ncbi:Lrp/AsnC family transcriptional regulator [Microbaculum marinisediminis]|uniref:Lrp/AsnC family transcriptional regulator n=1 Tax=Microbaculum marinisediminis TaxID=2931392 RepID=A0AAW5R5L3_9HYPH|nr:Lrp/AsnC family transcriptional regulator [Microbaculum sp. A6E488]MCT8974198.1 Lrp/AsnC family transcriptional regulator [Microbaculum sp. A6E488]
MPIALDDRDVRILQILCQEGRISKSELARRVNLSATPCWERLKRLEAQGLIRGYRAEIALARIAPHVTIFVVAELESHRTDDFRIFEQAIARRDEIIACWAIGGGFDYLLQIVTTDINAYQRLVDALLGERIGLKRYFTYIVTKDVKADAAPPLGHLLGRQDT